MSQQLSAIAILLFTILVTCNGCYYKKFTPNHTACKPRNSKCNILNSTVTEEEKVLVVKFHNNFREKVAKGLATGGLPSASNMMEMVWDDELAMIAQKHVETCDFKRDCQDCRRVDRFNVGQNLFFKLSRKIPYRVIWMRMAQFFYKEADKFRKEYISTFKSGSGYSLFSQMVWAESWRLGCGKVVFKAGKQYKTFISCNYGPVGNSPLKSVYKIGKPCTACPNNTCCGESCERYGIKSNYAALCKKIK